MQMGKWYAAIDTHSGGEPLRIVTGGLPQMAGDSMQAKASYFRQHFDSVRKLLLSEPRGHYGMTGAIVTAPVAEASRFGLLFLHHEGVAAISGHGILAAVTAWIETGQLGVEEAAEGIFIDCPAGTVQAFAGCEGDEVRTVSFRNVPSFAYAKRLAVRVQGIELRADVAFSGEFYAVVDVSLLGGFGSLPDLQAWGGTIRAAIESQLMVKHPQLEWIAGVHGVFFYERDSGSPDMPVYRAATVFAGEQLDRSPGGAAACAHMAVMHHCGALETGRQVVYEGIAGARAIGVIDEETSSCGYGAVVPRLEGDAFVLGFMQFAVDPADPLSAGFVLH